MENDACLLLLGPSRQMMKLMEAKPHGGDDEPWG